MVDCKKKEPYVHNIDSKLKASIRNVRHYFLCTDCVHAMFKNRTDKHLVRAGYA